VSALETARHIARCLEEDGLAYAIGGALALTVHALPRETADIDISIFASDDDLPRVIDALERAGVMIDRPDAQRAQQRTGMFTGRAGRRLVDVFMHAHPHFIESARRRVSVEIAPGESVWFVSVEDFCVNKLLFARGKDLPDLEHVFAAHPDLDVVYVRHWLSQMVPAGDRRFAILDDLVRRFIPAR
jgi:hypothetical protein